MAYLAEQHQSGREIILTTAAEANLASRVADHLGFFSAVIATSGNQNCAGAGKLQKIQDQLGCRAFVYAGNGRVDLAIWRHSESAIVVNASRRLIGKVAKLTHISHVFIDQKFRLLAFLRAIRVYQWVKNGLVFLPLLAGHHLDDVSKVLDSILAFVAFSLCSSGTYVINDLLDLEADRRHPTKKHRSFASGDLTVKVGLIGTPFLLAAGLGLSLLLPLGFTFILIAYFVAALAYSLYLKKLVIVDVLLLALLYTSRIIGGGLATEIWISNWLLVFSMFLFLSLALLKRFAELQNVLSNAKEADKSRGYSTADREQLASMGSASGYMTALVMGLYINSEDVNALYAHPEFLWLICPLILYWISRAWLIARRGGMHDDPVVFAIKDKASYAVALLTAIILVFAIS
jgi:4-hydroxybenzoate polyprenyltransferase